MSDIHGNARRFNSIMQQIDLQPEDTLYVLGDVIDRYPDGIRTFPAPYGCGTETAEASHTRISSTSANRCGGKFSTISMPCRSILTLK